MDSSQRSSPLIAQEPEQDLPVGPLLVSVGFVLASAVWVYVDAKSIGARKGLVGGIANNSPPVWAIGTVVLWIVVVPRLPCQSRQDPARRRRGRPSVRSFRGGALGPTDWHHLRWNEAAQVSLEHLPLVGRPAGHSSPHPVGPPAGWYLDPEDERYHRWWDGTGWTEHRTPS